MSNCLMGAKDLLAYLWRATKWLSQSPTWMDVGKSFHHSCQGLQEEGETWLNL